MIKFVKDDTPFTMTPTEMAIGVISLFSRYYDGVYDLVTGCLRVTKGPREREFLKKCHTVLRFLGL